MTKKIKQNKTYVQPENYTPPQIKQAGKHVYTYIPTQTEKVCTNKWKNTALVMSKQIKAITKDTSCSFFSKLGVPYATFLCS